MQSFYQILRNELMMHHIIQNDMIPQTKHLSMCYHFDIKYVIIIQLYLEKLYFFCNAPVSDSSHIANCLWKLISRYQCSFQLPGNALIFRVVGNNSRFYKCDSFRPYQGPFGRDLDSKRNVSDLDSLEKHFSQKQNHLKTFGWLSLDSDSQKVWNHAKPLYWGFEPQCWNHEMFLIHISVQKTVWIRFLRFW